MSSDSEKKSPREIALMARDDRPGYLAALASEDPDRLCAIIGEIDAFSWDAAEKWARAAAEAQLSKKLTETTTATLRELSASADRLARAGNFLMAATLVVALVPIVTCAVSKLAP